METQEPITMSVDEGVNLAGVERKTLYAAIARGEVPGVVRIGRRIRLNKERFLEWLQGSEGKSESATA